MKKRNDSVTSDSREPFYNYSFLADANYYNANILIFVLSALAFMHIIIKIVHVFSLNFYCFVSIGTFYINLYVCCAVLDKKVAWKIVNLRH